MLLHRTTNDFTWKKCDVEDMHFELPLANMHVRVNNMVVLLKLVFLINQLSNY